jgi:hypothetical protein
MRKRDLRGEIALRGADVNERAVFRPREFRRDSEIGAAADAVRHLKNATDVGELAVVFMDGLNFSSEHSRRLLRSYQPIG